MHTQRGKGGASPPDSAVANAMTASSMVFSFFLIFTGAALLATLALYARQAMIVAYILLGVIMGPWGLDLVGDAHMIQGLSDIGIMFLLFLLGINLQPSQLWQMLAEALGVTLLSSLAFMALGLGIALAFGFSGAEAILIGATMMFSSTIIGLKLLPTTTLHHRHTGQVIISILLLQDVIAIITLLLLQGYGKGGNLVLDIALQLLYLPLLVGVAIVLERYVIHKLFARFDQIHEYIFLLTLGWCLGLAEIAAMLGLSHEIGAFIAGVALATSPIALFISESLKPLRDFFLILFFFSLGAGFDLGGVGDILAVSLLLALVMLVCKPYIFAWLLRHAAEKRAISLEIGVRLGQISEFALLIAVLALDSHFISARASNVIQLATLLTFIISSYVIVLRYRTPIAVNDRMRKD